MKVTPAVGEAANMGIGLEALDARLNAAFGDRSGMKIITEDEHNFIVQIDVPVIRLT